MPTVSLIFVFIGILSRWAVVHSTVHPVPSPSLRVGQSEDDARVEGPDGAGRGPRRRSSRRVLTRTARHRLSGGMELTDRDRALVLAGLFELRITHLEHADHCVAIDDLAQKTRWGPGGDVQRRQPTGRLSS